MHRRDKVVAEPQNLSVHRVNIHGAGG
jgi:hypothetical protein